MHLLALAHRPTDSLNDGFLPAAARLGLEVTVVTDAPDQHRAAYEGHPSRRARVVAVDVADHRAVITALGRLPPVGAVFTNSDHLQEQAALVADWLDLPGKDWRTAWACKNKALMRARLAAAGLDAVHAVEVPPGEDAAERLGNMAFPCVVKPREGVASEAVFLAETLQVTLARVADVRSWRPEATVLVEEYLPGDLRTLETLGDGERLHVLGGFRTELSPPPHFIEERLRFEPEPEPVHVAQVLGQLTALGVGLGACHTEYVVHEGRARLIEINYRAIGDQCDLVLERLLGIPYFELVLGAHLGHPLPQDLGARRDGRARMEYVCADRAGVLRSAPGPVDLEEDGVHLSYRPMRELGVDHPLTGTNRDYLGVVRASGTDDAAVDTAVERFLAGRRWEIAS